MTPETPAFIAVDWGTSSFRGYLAAADGRVLERRQSERGILTVEGGRFAHALENSIGDWISRFGALPVVMCGMIGSRQGWREVPYVGCPASASDLARGLVSFRIGNDAAGGVSAAIVPGVEARGRAGLPDVMRGEETQIVGCMLACGISGGRFLLPGTHCKWAMAEKATINGFSTYMTGEVFSALKQHTILGRLMSEPPSGSATPGFLRGLETVARVREDGRGPGALLQIVFSARTLGLCSEIESHEIPDYLSGLLIGAEIADASASGGGGLWIIGSDALAERYGRACTFFDLAAQIAPSDCVVAGLAAIAREASLIGGGA